MSIYRLAGAFLVALCFAMAGQKSRRRLRERAAGLAGLASSFSIMKNEIGFLRTPPEEIFASLSAGKGRESAFYQRLGENMKTGRTLAMSWEKTVEEQAGQLGLLREEKDELLRLGRALSRYDLEGTLAFVSAAEENFKAFAEKGAKKSETDGKLRFTLWAAAGIAAALLLI